MRQITVTETDGGQRLDKFLLKYFNAAPPPLIYRLLRQKTVKLNGKRAAGGEIARAGDEISVYLPDDRLESMSAPRNAAAFSSMDMPAGARCAPLQQADIVYEDGDLLILNKPAGMLCHSAQGSIPGETLIEAALAYLAEKGEYGFAKNTAFTPALCNRLDRNTSGVVVCGKTLPAVQEVCRAIAGDTAQKFYLTIAAGEIREPGVCESLYEKDAGLNRAVVTKKIVTKKIVTTRPDEAEEYGGKTAVTEYKPLKYSKEWGVTLLSARLVTGRSHQIRAHMRMIGHPIVGDAKYGDAGVNERFRKEFGVKCQLLHARELRFAGNAFGAGSRLYTRNGDGFVAPLPSKMEIIVRNIFGRL